MELFDQRHSQRDERHGRTEQLRRHARQRFQHVRRCLVDECRGAKRRQSVRIVLHGRHFIKKLYIPDADWRVRKLYEPTTALQSARTEHS